MCGRTWTDGCNCAATREEFDADVALGDRVAAESQNVLDLLHGELSEASERVMQFAAALTADPATCGGSAIADLFVFDGRAIWWSHAGDQFDLNLDAQPALRLVA